MNHHLTAGSRPGFSWLLFALTLLILTGCGPQSSPDAYADVPVENVERGKLLAEQHCGSCHELPDPGELDAATWETAALPSMGPLLGSFQHKNRQYNYRGDPDLRGPGYLAGNPQVSPEEWAYIVDYYTATAPAELPAQDRPREITTGLSLFEVRRPGLQHKNTHSAFLKIRRDSRAPLVVSDAATRMTYFLDRDLHPVDSLITDGPLVDIEFHGGGEAIACNIGLMEPNDGAHGKLIRLRQGGDRWATDSTDLLTGLHRPTQVLTVDLNRDDKTDYLICEFGYMQGGLIWMENQGAGGYRKHVISSLPGALKAHLLDYDQDGDTDIMALFAQGEEGIFLFTNDGNGQFTTRELLRFPALYGSSHFEIADFNGDGLPDLLYTAGDNADYTSVLKPYHGVYIFLNQGADTFEQAYFYPIHGCYKAMARDFDQDGDLDLATVAYYADFAAQPEEGFVFLENEGGLHFTPYTIAELEMGRWISMEVGDIDQDGRLDIALGNFVQPSSFSNPAIDWAAAPPVVVLKNMGR